ncbi:MAG TPA: ribose-5-phosphate isomerase RpiA [Thermoleophilaceae bacterium]|nr:ribose-5-phosphate isomerase RpiA [Thermoleophilaceae bacterium]
MGVSGAYEFSPGRAAAAAAAVELMEPEMTIGLGSGRGVWAVIEAIGARWIGPKPVRAVVASEATYAIAHAAGIDVVPLDGKAELDIAVDGTDEVDSELRLLKGGGGALLREKIVASAAKRFVVVAEAEKLTDRLGSKFTLPVEVVRFGWRDTRRRLSRLLPDAERRSVGDEAYSTDENHYILDCAIPPEVDLEALDGDLNLMPGVVEHGLFLGMAERVLLGQQNGTVQVLER